MIITVKEGFYLYYPIEEISIEKMQFNIINKRTEYNKKEFQEIKSEIEKELFSIFLKYQ